MCVILIEDIFLFKQKSFQRVFSMFVRTIKGMYYVHSICHFQFPAFVTS